MRRPLLLRSSCRWPEHLPPATRKTIELEIDRIVVKDLRLWLAFPACLGTGLLIGVRLMAAGIRTYGHPLGFTLFLLCNGMAWWLFWKQFSSVWNRHSKKVLASHGLCLECGYDLRGIAGRCPECGTAVPNASQWTWSASAEPRQQVEGSPTA